jgi:hypothetical protein
MTRSRGDGLELVSVVIDPTCDRPRRAMAGIGPDEAACQMTLF